jgi:hypothetical protein
VSVFSAGAEERFFSREQIDLVLSETEEIALAEVPFSKGHSIHDILLRKRGPFFGGVGPLHPFKTHSRAVSGEHPERCRGQHGAAGKGLGDGGSFSSGKHHQTRSFRPPAKVKAPGKGWVTARTRL